MIENFYKKKKVEWKERARRLFSMDLANFFDGKLILQAPPFFAGTNTAPTAAIYPVVLDISECPTLLMPAITTKLPKTPSGNLR